MGGYDYRVAYADGAKRRYLAGNFPLPLAEKNVRMLKRQGRTAWVEDDSGNHVPTKGVTRDPSRFYK